MKKQGILLTLIVALFATTAMGQEITGKWNGILKVPGAQLRLVFNISRTDSGYSSTMDSPDQGAKGIPMPTTSFVNDTLKIAHSQAMIQYAGVLGEDDNIKGTFTQRGASFALDLTRGEVEKEKHLRPQEPQPPFPYSAEDIFFNNVEAGIQLAGTLTLPSNDGVFPAVVLISGSGAQNRDEELMGHKPFLVIADYLTRNGIAVLRFDDRGTAKSGGKISTATSSDFATDVEAAVKYLLTRKEINPKKIGLIGHSEGGVIAPMVAVKTKDVAYIILLAGTGVSGGDVLLKQQEDISRLSGVKESDMQKSKEINSKIMDIARNSADAAQFKVQLEKFMSENLKNYPAALKNNMSDEQLTKIVIQQYASPWMHYFIKYDPATTLRNVKCPVLALNGEKDIQVDAKINLEAIKKALADGGNKKAAIVELPGLNHLFQECQTGAVDEYEKIEQTFSPTALDPMLRWIKEQVK